MNYVSFPSDDCLGVEEGVVLITKFNLVLSRLLVPMHFFLEKDVVILTFKLFFQDNVVDGINLVKVILDSFDSFLNMFLPLENVAKDLLIEID